MKHLKLFILFWKNFIFGDSPLIALLLLWVIASVYTFTHYNFNVWWLLPIIVAVIIVSSTVTSLRSLTNNYLYSCSVLFIGSSSVTILPLLLFRLGAAHTLATFAPLITTIVVSFILAAGCALLTKKRPIAGHCLALGVSLLMVYY